MWFFILCLVSLAFGFKSPVQPRSFTVATLHSLWPNNTLPWCYVKPSFSFDPPWQHPDFESWVGTAMEDAIGAWGGGSGGQANLSLSKQGVCNGQLNILNVGFSVHGSEFTNGIGFHLNDDNSMTAALAKDTCWRNKSEVKTAMMHQLGHVMGEFRNKGTSLRIVQASSTSTNERMLLATLSSNAVSSGITRNLLMAPLRNQFHKNSKHSCRHSARGLSGTFQRSVLITITHEQLASVGNPGSRT